MKECIKCGKEIEDNALYCQYCGESQREKKDGVFKKLFKYTRNYVIEEPKKENSLVKFMTSSMNIAFILLIIYAILCGLYDFLGIFVYLSAYSFVDSFVSITSTIGALLVIIVSLRAIKEITKLGQAALGDEKSKEILVKIFSGGIVFIGIVFFIFLN